MASDAAGDREIVSVLISSSILTSWSVNLTDIIKNIGICQRLVKNKEKPSGLEGS